MRDQKKYKRGYPIAVLAGFEKDQAVLWRIYSNVAKHEKTISAAELRNDVNTLYRFHEAIIDALRPILKEGVRSLILASPPRTNYSQGFIDHLRRHHTWLNQGSTKLAISEIVGNAGTPSQVSVLARTAAFYRLVEKTTSEETEDLIELLDRKLNLSGNEHAVLFSLEEAEGAIVKKLRTVKCKVQYLLITDTHLQGSSQKDRLNRLIQIAKNKNVKTRIINAETPSGKRISQMGGIVCLMQESQPP